MSLIEFLPEALEEVVAATRWYEQQREGLGEEFVDELEDRIRRAVELPGLGRLEPNAPERFALRRYALKRFPYALLIGNLGDRRVVVAVAHERRKPGYWKRRLTGGIGTSRIVETASDVSPGRFNGLDVSQI